MENSSKRSNGGEGTKKSTLKWSRQVKPMLGDRRIWKKYIEKLCYGENKLIISLGKWINPTHQIWNFMVTKDKMYLLRYENGVQKNDDARRTTI